MYHSVEKVYNNHEGILTQMSAYDTPGGTIIGLLVHCLEISSWEQEACKDRDMYHSSLIPQTAKNGLTSMNLEA